MTKRRKDGFTLLELIVVLVILSLVLYLGVPGVGAFFNHIEINSGLRMATVALQSARYKSILLNKRIKLQLAGQQFLLMEKQSGKWQMIFAFEPVSNVSLRMSAFPVFSPYGTVSPLCSIYVKNDRRQYKISISMAGRIKVAEL